MRLQQVEPIHREAANLARGAPAPALRPHLLITGTGRAGTSFLVRYLAAMGLETHLQARGEEAYWDEAANAGLEDLPVTAVSGPMPYVIKSPAAAEVIDDVLADPTIRLDAVIIPVRDLMEAASSRTTLELRALHHNAPWMTRLSKTWEVQGHTPGGVLYSLDPVDQARLLAVSFHKLVERLVAVDVPVIFLSFPRFVEDEEYLWSRLRSLMPANFDRDVARRAHATVADSAKVRIGEELARVGARPGAPGARQGRLAGLDRVALSRELERVRSELAAGGERTSALHAELAEREGELRGAQQRLEAMASASRALGELAAERELEVAQLEEQLEAAERVRQEAERLRQEIEASTSWRLTAPLRSLVRRVRRGGRQ